MSKTLKKVIIIAAIVVGVIGAAIAILFIVKNSSTSEVSVVSVESVGMVDYYASTGESYGLVTADKIQKVYASDTQEIKEITVKEGDEVKIGDLLVTYDTTLTDIDLEKAEIDVQRLNLKLEKAQSELSEINNLVPYSITYVEPETEETEYVTLKTPKIVSGSGTEIDPLRCLMDEDDSINDELIKKLLEAAPKKKKTSKTDVESESETETETTTDEKTVYVAFVTRYENALNGVLERCWGLQITETGEKITLNYYSPELTEEELEIGQPEEGYFKEDGSPFTSEEIAELRTEKEGEISSLQKELKSAQVELEKVKTEIKDNYVYAKFDGTVKAVRSQTDAEVGDAPVLEISAGGGFYIEISVSELKLDEISVGQIVTVSSWETGLTCEGSVVSVSEYPTDSDSYGTGNTNVSYYPVKISVSEDEELEEGSYVSVAFDNEESSGLYLLDAYVRTDDGSYVYVDNNGVLEKRQIKTGATLWGSYVEILDGLSIGDYVAFPYGSDVKEGAKTTKDSDEYIYY